MQHANNRPRRRQRPVADRVAAVERHAQSGSELLTRGSALGSVRCFWIVRPSVKSRRFVRSGPYKEASRAAPRGAAPVLVMRCPSKPARGPKAAPPPQPLSAAVTAFEPRAGLDGHLM